MLAKIPRMTTTIRISMSVNPRDLGAMGATRPAARAGSARLRVARAAWLERLNISLHLADVVPWCRVGFTSCPAFVPRARALAAPASREQRRAADDESAASPRSGQTYGATARSAPLGFDSLKYAVVTVPVAQILPEPSYRPAVRVPRSYTKPVVAPVGAAVPSPLRTPDWPFNGFFGTCCM